MNTKSIIYTYLSICQTQQLKQQMRHHTQAIAEQNTAHNQHLSQQITHHSLALSRQAMAHNQQIYAEMATGNHFPVLTVSVALTLITTYNKLNLRQEID